MGLTYFKRFRMEADVSRLRMQAPQLPTGYSFQPWDELRLEEHAEVKYRCFHGEMDAYVLPSLSQKEGCLRLMREITRRDGFLASATWLLQHENAATGQIQCCGTIQGVLDQTSKGWIQNVGVAPEHRGKGLGTCLLCKSLDGFREAGAKRISLEVTAKNRDAIRLYRRLGFRQMRVVYKTANVAYA